jgi:prophage DNA circulation protein
MALFDDTDGLLPGLLPAAWRGGSFWMINSSHSVGRRIHAVLYPGLDLKTHDDTGPLDGPFRISGLVIGDDYVGQARALAAKFRQPGPATLMHPWWGPVRCVLLRPAQIEFDVQELRVARIDAEFDPLQSGAKAQLAGTLAGVLSALTALASAGTGLAALALAASPMAFALYSRGIAATEAALGVAGQWASRSRRSAELLPAVSAARAQFSVAAAKVGRAEASALLAAVPASLSMALEAVFKPRPAPGIGPGGEALPVIEPDPRRGAELMLTIAADLGRRLRPGEPEGVMGLPALEPAAVAIAATEKAVLVAAETAALVAAAGLVVTIPFASQQEAQGWAGRIDEALRRNGGSATGLAAERLAPAATLWRAVNAARARLAMDLSQTIGRLPAVRRVTPPGSASALLLAQHLAGDDPAQVFAFAEDIVARNRLRHPALLGSGPVEVLQ